MSDLRKRKKQASNTKQTLQNIVDRDEVNKGHGKGGTQEGDFFSHTFERIPWNAQCIVAFTVVVISSFMTRMYKLEFPPKVLFDEVHFVTFAQQYAAGRHVFDIHPPLAKLALGLIVHLTGFHTNASYREIGTVYTHPGYIAMRQWQGFHGGLLAPVCFLSVREMGGSLSASFLSAMLLVMELSFQTISRAVFMDSFLYSTIAFGTLFALRCWHSRTNLSLLVQSFMSGLFMGCAFSVKHTGLGVLGVVGVFHIVATFRPFFAGRASLFDVVTGKMFRGGLVMLLTWLTVHVGVFAVHFAVGGERRRHAWNLLRDIVELNVRMVEESQRHKFDHHHGSQWPEWPVLYRGLVYWWEDLPDGTHTCVYLFGNPFVFWFVLLCVVATLYLMDKKMWVVFVEKAGKFQDVNHLWGLAFCLFGWLVNYVPYALFINRTCFVYHYHPSLFFGICLAGLFVDRAFQNHKIRSVFVFVLLLFVLVLYVYYLPFSYALPITQDEHDQRRMMYFFPYLKKVFPIW